MLNAFAVAGKTSDECSHVSCVVIGGGNTPLNLFKPDQENAVLWASRESEGEKNVLRAA